MQLGHKTHTRRCKGVVRLLVATQELTLAIMVAVLVLPPIGVAQDMLPPFTSPISDEMPDALATGPREGDLDTSFSGDGKVFTNFGGRFDMAVAIVIQPDGKIVVAGNSFDFSVSPTDRDLVLARYLPNGTLDATFSGDGKVRTNLGGFELVSAMALQPDGKIILAVSSGEDIVLTRYMSNGTLDNTFSGDGKVTTNLIGNEHANAVAVQSDGKIVVAGITSGFLVVVRYLPNGSLDNTFNGNGWLTTSIGFGTEATALAIQSDGKIVVAGGADIDIEMDTVVARYLPIGTLDATFSGDGWVTTDLGIGDIAETLALQPDGKIVVISNGLTAHEDGNVISPMTRYLPNGTLDSTFGGDGTVLIDFGGDNNFATGLALQPDGKIVVAGFASSATDSYMALARYLSNGTLDATFSGDGKVRTEFGDVLAIQPRDGRLVVAGTFPGTSGTGDIALARFHAISCNGVVVTRIGTASNDTIIGTSGNDVIYAFGGNDFIDGLGGNDIICGGGGNDILEGGSGDDTLSGGPGTDICRGEAHVFGDRASQCESVTGVP